MPETIGVEPFGARITGLGWEASVNPASRGEQNQTGFRRLEPNQRGIPPQRESVGDPVRPLRDVNRFVLRNGFPEYGGIVGGAVAFGSQVDHVHPGRLRRQLRKILLRNRSHRGKLDPFHHRIPLAGRLPGVSDIDMQPVRKSADGVRSRFAGDLQVAFRHSGEASQERIELQEHGNAVAFHVVHIDLRFRVVVTRHP